MSADGSEILEYASEKFPRPCVYRNKTMYGFMFIVNIYVDTR